MDARALTGRDAAVYLSILRLGYGAGDIDRPVSEGLQRASRLHAPWALGSGQVQAPGSINDDMRRAS